MVHLSGKRRIAWPAMIIFLLGIILAMSACESGAPAPGSKAAATATAAAAAATTPPPLSIKSAHALVWKKHTLPAGIGLTNFTPWGSGLAIAPSDGNTAYGCRMTTNEIEIWATHDQAEHWARVATVSRTAHIMSCTLVVDANQAKNAILVALPMNSPAFDRHRRTDDIRSYVTSDSGTTWVKLAAPAGATPIFTALAIQGNTTYALVRGTCFNCAQALYRSTDGLKTWSRADTGVFSQKDGRTVRSIASFHVASNGNLLATVQGGDSSELWRSTDGGAHWSKFSQTKDSVTSNSTGPNQGILVPGGQVAFWRACVSNTKSVSRSAPQTLQITCTLDGGKTWLATGGGDNTGKRLVAQASDGALLATTFDGHHSAMVRIAPGQKKWESLGDVPGAFTFTYALGAGGNTGVLWSKAQFTKSGLIIYTATYP